MKFTKINDIQYECDITTELRLTLTEVVDKEQPYTDGSHYYIVALKQKTLPGTANYVHVVNTHVIRKLIIEEMLQGEAINVILEELNDKAKYYFNIKQDIKMHSAVHSKANPTKKTIVIMHGDNYLMLDTGEIIIFDTIDEATECQLKTGGEIKEVILFCDKKINWKDAKDKLED